MTEEFPQSFDSVEHYRDWVALLATNAIRSANGQAADANYTGDLAPSIESRLEYDIELEVDDKLDVLAETQTPFDVLRLTNRSPTELAFNQLPMNKTTTETALYFAHDALIQDVLDFAIDQFND